MMDPRYRDVKQKQIPEVKLSDGIVVKIVAGEIAGERGPVRDIIIDPEYFDVLVPPRSEFRHRTKSGHTVFAYIMDGKGYFCKEKQAFSYERHGINYFDISSDPLIGNRAIVIFDDGEEIAVSTEDQKVRFLLISGKPLGEPVAWYGPIVMNTQEELQTAFEEYNQGTFIKYKN
jgi:redox-sensitive bicupin YhaK (pirin superfamily)